MTDETVWVTNVEEMPHDEFDWGSITWLMNKSIAPEARQTFGVVYINPAMTNTLHSHPNCEELLYVMQGECEHTLGDDVYRLKTGDLIRIPPNTKHHATNIGWAPVVMVISYSAPDRETDTHAG